MSVFPIEKALHKCQFIDDQLNFVSKYHKNQGIVKCSSTRSYYAKSIIQKYFHRTARPYKPQIRPLYFFYALTKKERKKKENHSY